MLKLLEEKVKSSALVVSGLIVGLCLAVYWLGPSSVWESNDDVYYHLLFSGQWVTSAPNAHTVVLNFVLSSCFTQLYTVAPNIHWYGYFHVAALLLSVWFLNYCYALTHANDKLLTRIALSLVTVLPFLILLQFTKTAAVLALAGYLGLYMTNQANLPSSRQNLLLHAGAGVLLLLSFALRRESFLMMTLLCSLLLAGALLKRKRALPVTLATVAVLILTMTLLHRLNYGEEWKDFFAVGRAFSAIIDFNQYSYEGNQQVYADAGLSRNDYDFFKNWGYADSRIYSPERLADILANGKKVAPQRSLLAVLQDAVSFPAGNYILTVSGFTLLLLFVYRQEYRVLFLYVFLPLLICAGLVAWQGRFPARVSTSLFFFLPWLVLVFGKERRKQLFFDVASAAALLALTLPVYGQLRDLTEIVNYRQMQNQDLHRLGATLSSPPTIFITFGDSFPYEGLFPFESPAYLVGGRFVWLCSMNQSPVQKKQLIENGISDLFKLLSVGMDAYIVLDPAAFKVLNRYIFEHYGKQINLSPAFIGKSFTAYRVAS